MVSVEKHNPLGHLAQSNGKQSFGLSESQYRGTLVADIFATVDKAQRVGALKCAIDLLKSHRPIPFYSHFEAFSQVGRIIGYLKGEIEQLEDSAECYGCGEETPLGELKRCFECSERFCVVCRKQVKDVREAHSFLPITDEHANTASHCALTGRSA